MPVCTGREWARTVMASIGVRKRQWVERYSEPTGRDEGEVQLSRPAEACEVSGLQQEDGRWRGRKWRST